MAMGPLSGPFKKSRDDYQIRFRPGHSVGLRIAELSEISVNQRGGLPCAAKRCPTANHLHHRAAVSTRHLSTIKLANGASRSHLQTENAPPRYDGPSDKDQQSKLSEDAISCLSPEDTCVEPSGAFRKSCSGGHKLSGTCNGNNDESASFGEHDGLTDRSLAREAKPISKRQEAQGQAEFFTEISTRESSSPAFDDIDGKDTLSPSCEQDRSLSPVSDRSHRPRRHCSTLDRYISPRRPNHGSRTTFLISKPTSHLVRRQKLLRRGARTSDPFAFPETRNHRVGHPNPQAGSLSVARSSPLRAAGILQLRPESQSNATRHVSGGSVWNVGGVVAPPNLNNRINDGRGGLIRSGTHARVYTSNFFGERTSQDGLHAYEKRLALAVEVDQAERVLSLPSGADSVHSISSHRVPNKAGSKSHTSSISLEKAARPLWRDNKWMREGNIPFLEAPGLRDDYYCSILAYSRTADRLAVALGNRTYLWSEKTGVLYPPDQLGNGSTRSAYITSLSFSSESGGCAILATGGGDGRVILWSPLDEEPRFLRFMVASSVTYTAFRPMSVRRPSQRHPALLTENEVLLVGDDKGMISVYFVEWPNETDRFLFGWHGGIHLHAQIISHTQQICGITWSTDGESFASGGNDNMCCLFQTHKVLSESRQTLPAAGMPQVSREGTAFDVATGQAASLTLGPEDTRHHWRLNAAVKAIAFCPWQRGLLAAGGGSNDRCIHFFHTISGACLSTIDCAAQITSLVWSNTRREIAATFGFAQPEHPFRIAVYSWPACNQIVAIPWHREMRALYALPYPRGPEAAQRPRGAHAWRSRTEEEGTIVVAASDGSIKFHEIWSGERRATAPHQGLFCGSDILDGLHGIEKESREVIR